jgi:hypothetical protein
MAAKTSKSIFIPEEPTMGFYNEQEHGAILKWIGEHAEEFVYWIFPKLKDKAAWDLLSGVQQKAIMAYKNKLLRQSKRFLDYIDCYVQQKYYDKDEKKYLEACGRHASFQDLIAEKLKCINKNIEESKRIYNLTNSAMPAVKIDRKIMDYEVKNDSGHAGFVDMCISFFVGTIAVSGSRFSAWAEQKYSILIESQAKYANLDDLLCQLNRCRALLGKNDVVVVVSPDNSGKRTIERRGFKFVKCPV